ncbi:CoA-binding protein [Hyunsoonleella pacifica]|uniref:CoA-binding protein n=1 Tax=Hyunsoonleella pacifica TaxID=1080224 RepID=A0A4Q9FNC5_9FLAO|nr:CoA-binding protein [Hyunsoonleella pacifica]TBN13814.1 CoA-binding protein [Hyunsoonleella pacifica]GGD25884.1 CoA-binding protein [Hyunsoonleella pacifica]
MNKKTLVLGASLKPNRYSNYAIQRLVANKVETVAFGLREGEVSGIVIDTELLNYENIHTVTLYLNPKRQKEYYSYIVSLNPKRVIFNPGTENPEFYEILKENNIAFEAACTLVLLSTNQY